MEDHKPFKPVTVMTSKPGLSRAIGSAYDAAVFVLEDWPEREGPKLTTAKQILLKCLAGECTAAVARVAFIEAARESGVYVTPPEVDPLTAGRKAPRWGKRKYPLLRDRRTK